VTVAAGTNAVRHGVVTVAPFVEATFARPESVERLAAFEPRAFYGSDQLWLLSLGARVNLGARHRRMGRYGTATGNVAGHAQMATTTKTDGC